MVVQKYPPDSSHHFLLLLGKSQSVSGTAKVPFRQVSSLAFAAGYLTKRLRDYKAGGHYVLIPVVATMWLKSLQNFDVYMCKLLPCIYTRTAGSFKCDVKLWKVVASPKCFDWRA